MKQSENPADFQLVVGTRHLNGEDGLIHEKGDRHNFLRCHCVFKVKMKNGIVDK